MKVVLVLPTAILAAAWVGLSSNSIAVGQPPEFSLKDLPTFYLRGDEYKVDPYIAAAAKFQAAGKDKAIKALRKEGTFDGTIVLCRMLFTAKAKKEFRRPLIGEARFLGSTSYKDWPREPIEVVDGVPFLIVRSYALEGLPELDYLAYCAMECDWGSAEFKPRSMDEKQKVLTKLLASPKWKVRLDEEEKAYLAAQIK